MGQTFEFHHLFRGAGLMILLMLVALGLPSSASSAPVEAHQSFASRPQASPEVGKWRRLVIDLPNDTFSGNPFDLQVDAAFTHSSSGEVIDLPGYYAGNNIWKIAFMPTEVGEWTYATSSSDGDLDGVTGSLTAVSSANPGTLKSDPDNPRKWKYSDGPYAIPLVLQLNIYDQGITDAEFTSAADFLGNQVGGHMFGTGIAIEPSLVFDGLWQNNQFDVTYWDRFERRMEILTERGLGAYLLFYSDDALAPPWGANSTTEQLLIRYAVARLSSYPVIWFDSGIDIDEYRDQAWIDSFGSQLRALEPYAHPVSSRYGGGSGTYVMAGQTYDSRGDRTAIVDDMTNYFLASNVPVAMSDFWGENRPSHPQKDFSPADIRRAAWKSVVSGGSAAFIRGSNGKFEAATIQTDLESEQFLVNVNPFVESALGSSFGQMVPEPSLVSNGYAIADPARSKILYFLMGQNDRYDAGDGGPMTADLSGLTDIYLARWLDTRTGSEIAISDLSGGTSHILTPPTTDDWVILLDSQSAPSPSPTPTATPTLPPTPRATPLPTVDCPIIPRVGVASRDLNGDGLCGDINANGREDFDDVVEIFQYHASPAPQPYPEFDFNLNGIVDYDDIVSLFVSFIP